MNASRLWFGIFATAAFVQGQDIGKLATGFVRSSSERSYAVVNPRIGSQGSAVPASPNSFTLTVRLAGTGRGTVINQDSKINCGTVCSASFDSETMVTLTAVPASGSAFSGWSGCSSSTPTCTVKMNSVQVVAATFIQQSVPVLANFSIIPSTVVGGVSTQGLIMLSGPAPANTTVTLTDNNPHFAQIPPPGSTTTGSVSIPQGALGATFPITTSFTSGPAGVTIAATDGTTFGASVTVQPVAINGVAFSPSSVVGGSPATLMVSLNGPAGSGTLVSLTNSDPSVLQIPSTMEFPAGTNNLSIPGQTSSVQTPKVVTVTASYNLSTAPPVSLTIVPSTFLLSVMKQGTGAGTVTSNVGSISCGATCSASYNNGTSVTLTAVASVGSTFASWIGCDSTSGSTCTVAMNSDRTVTTTFNVLPSKLPLGADFDGDGKTDFAVWRPDPNNGTWWVVRSSDNGTVTRGWGVTNDKPVPGDYDGDGKTDFAVWRPDPNAGTWWVVRSSDGGVVSQTWGVAGDIPVPGDYDGDGKTDLAVWRPSTGTWYVIRSSDGAVMTREWGVTGDVPVPGDYDGDGKTDFAVWRPSTGTWYVIRSSDGGVMSRTWGVNGDVPVPGDYDGDGHTDFAVWRPSTGTWWVIRSSDEATLTQTWGMTGDTPVPGDYDGDGKMDFAVWRPSTGTWYINRSSDGVQFSRTWGVSTDVPVNKPIGQ